VPRQATLPVSGLDHTNVGTVRTIDSFMDGLRDREPHLPLFHQAAEAVARSVWPTLHQHPAWGELRIFERLLDPDRELRFRVDWVDDEGAVHTETAWRIQHSDLLGPYKGGLRFTPRLNRDTLRFLAFEQSFKGALTGLPQGGAKGGSTFDPHGRSDAEVMRFCQAFMSRLADHIGAHLDVPAGDMNVGARELGYLFGAYRRVHAGAGRGVLTGKPIASGGIELRTEATGYGLIYTVLEALRHRDEDLADRVVAVSGAGNVALHAAEKAIEEGAVVISLSDTSGTLHVKEGLDAERLDRVRDAKASGNHLRDVAGDVGGRMVGTTPWHLEPAIALPCAMQNELGVEDATALVKSGCTLVAEGANMPCTAEAVGVFHESGVARLPGKLANAGGVSVSGFEMAQNAQLVPWTRDRVDEALRDRMRDMHARTVEHGTEGSHVDYERGANVTAFLRLAQAMESQGV